MAGVTCASFGVLLVDPGEEPPTAARCSTAGVRVGAAGGKELVGRERRGGGGALQHGGRAVAAGVEDGQISSHRTPR